MEAGYLPTKILQEMLAGGIVGRSFCLAGYIQD
jgi:hypothetical protein